MNRKLKILLFTVITALIEVYFIISFIAPMVEKTTLLSVIAAVGFIVIIAMNYNIFKIIFEEKK